MVGEKHESLSLQMRLLSSLSKTQAHVTIGISGNKSDHIANKAKEVTSCVTVSPQVSLQLSSYQLIYVTLLFLSLKSVNIIHLYA